MRLADFIEQNVESILVRWEGFASTLVPAARTMNELELRDHAEQLLAAIVADLRTPQTREEQAAKSTGRAPLPAVSKETAAQTHAVLRARSGFDIKQLASEYRALRASVLSLWLDADAAEATALDDVIRFNEAIDQGLAESIGHFSAQVEQSRNLLLGMLGHDMRSPLQAIQLTAHRLSALNAGQQVSDAAHRLIVSGGRIQSLLDDLVDFNRTKLGLGINVERSPVDLRRLFSEEVSLIRVAHPGREVHLRVTGDSHGIWDGKRLQQLLGNLVTNALAYGEPGAAVRVEVTGDGADVRIEVRNSGASLPSSDLAELFQPLKRGARTAEPTNLGLGLYIVSEIAKAHGGEADARSTGNETIFSVRLPRRQ